MNNPAMPPVQTIPLKKLGCTLPFELADLYAPVFTNFKLRPEVLLTSADAVKANSIEMRSVAALCRECGGCTVHAPFISMFWDEVDSEMEKKTTSILMASADSSAVLGADSAVIHTNWDPRIETLDEWLSKKVAGLAKVTEYYLELGIRPLIENVRESKPDQLLRIRAELHEQTGICIDPGHASVISDVSTPDWFKAVKPYLGEIHLHNNNKDFDAHLPLSEGTGWNPEKDLNTLIEEEYTFFPVMEPKDKEAAIASIQALTKWGLRAG
jgi:sugar phosphate isomerase/epimerase